MENSKLEQLELALTLGDKKYHDGFDVSPYGDSLEPGSMPADGLYEYWMQTYKPEIVVEVGSFLGYSAIKMAKEVQRLNLKTKIICVDTWLGSLEHYILHKGEGKYDRLGYKNGYPTMYQKFISNAILHGVKDIIQPLPFPSSTGANILSKVFADLNLKADFIFVDGSHDEYDAFFDCFNYFPLLKDGGTMWGDDWGADGVRNAATRFASDNGLNLSVLNNRVHWVIQK